MEAFATIEDLVAGWRELDQDEEGPAEELLLRASGFIAAEMAARGVAVDPADDLQALNLKTVCCNVARRSMSPAGGDGVASMSQTIGSTSASVTWSNPTGAFFLTRAERTMLGLAAGGLYHCVRARAGGSDVG